MNAITNEQIESFRAEAAEAGDLAMVQLCDRALDQHEDGCPKDSSAFRAVCQCITAASAMAED